MTAVSLIYFIHRISVGGTQLCTERCELSFELGCARAYFPEPKRDMIAAEWQAPVVNGLIELQEHRVHDYAPLKVKVQSVEFEWPADQHNVTVSECKKG